MNNIKTSTSKICISSPLHSLQCEESDADFDLMRLKLKEDIESQYRYQPNKDYTFTEGHHVPPLFAAYYSGHIRCIELLVGNGAYPDIINFNGATLMNYAINDENLDLVEILLKNKSNPDLINRGRESFIKQAIFKPKVMELLLKYGASTKDDENKSCLIESVLFGDLECTALLLLYNASTKTDFNLYNANSLPHCAIEKIITLENKIEMLKLLHKFGINLNSINNSGDPVIEVLRLKNNEESLILVEEITKMVSSCLTLKSLARLTVKKMYGKNLLKILEEPEIKQILPVSVVEFMKFS